MNTAQDLVDNNITMFGYPNDYRQWIFNNSEDPALKKLAETYHFAETWDEYWNTYEYYIQEKGTHADCYTYLRPPELKMGKWWRSTEHIPGMNPYKGWITRLNWYLNEVIFTIISFLFMNTILKPISIQNFFS